MIKPRKSSIIIEAPEFAKMVRNLALVGFAIAVAAEAAAYLLGAALPPDLLGTIVMSATFLITMTLLKLVAMLLKNAAAKKVRKSNPVRWRR